MYEVFLLLMFILGFGLVVFGISASFIPLIKINEYNWFWVLLAAIIGSGMILASSLMIYSANYSSSLTPEKIALELQKSKSQISDSTTMLTLSRILASTDAKAQKCIDMVLERNQ